MAMKRGAGGVGTPDVLQKLGRPGFPSGMKVLLVDTAKERQEIVDQMQKLGYQVTSCDSCSQARVLLSSKAAGLYDIVLAEANLFSKENGSGQLLLEAASTLPLVLVAEPGATTESVWRGIEVGAAEVLEKPLSPLKLQNIWQHVVRKVMDSKDQPEGLCKHASLPSIGGGSPSRMEVSSYPSSRCTLSSNMSAVTAAPLASTGSLMVDEASYSGSQKDGSQDASMSNTSPENSHTVDGPLGASCEMIAEMKPAKKAKGPGGLALYHQPSTLRSCSSQPLSAASSYSSMTTVMGMVHPSFASTQAASQAGRGNIPPGCVWGTPLNPPPGWQGGAPGGQGLLLGSAAASVNFSRCHSAPTNKIDTFCSSIEGCDVLPDLDPALMVNLTDDLLLGDDFLGCGDNFLDCLGASCAPSIPPEPLLEMPPIGLSLRKSESLVNLINQHLTQCQIKVGAS